MIILFHNLFKAHNKGYTKKDGTYVAPFDDKREGAEPKPGKGYSSSGWGDKFLKWKEKKKDVIEAKKPVPTAAPAPKQTSLFGYEPSAAPAGGYKKAPAYHKPKPKAIHPKKGEKGEAVGIYNPSKATAPETWRDPAAVATWTPDSKAPLALNGVEFSKWEDHPRTEEGWDYVEGQMEDLEEPAMNLNGKAAASGVIVEEPDGRIWLVHPTNGFAGYKATFPKGGAEEGLSLQANAIKEAYEESGLKVEITGYFGDFERSTTVARYYVARRVGGTPTDCGWETQAVSLVPKDKLLDLLNGAPDKPVAIAAGAPAPKGVAPVNADKWKKVGQQLGSNPGGFYKDENGVDWYCKQTKSTAHAKNEVLASKLYEEAGVKVPSMMLIERGGKVGVASKIIHGLEKDPDGLMDGAVAGVHEGFAADCWLANWDSVGLLYDNMLVDEQGVAVRIDPGGSLLFRAQGEPKGSAFGDEVKEIETLRNGMNKQAAAVFGNITDEEISEGVAKLALISDSRIRELVDNYGPGTAAQRTQLADRLIARLDDLVNRFAIF